MPFIVPLTNDGSRKATYNLGGKDYVIETYYLPKTKCWLMDIYDVNDNPILTGVKLIPGVDNLIKGLCVEFDEQGFQVQTTDGGNNDTPESLGTTAFLIYYAKGEEIPAAYEDKCYD